MTKATVVITISIFQCGPELRKHYAKTWREHIKDQLNNLGNGWGSRYADSIMKVRDQRHLFAH